MSWIKNLYPPYKAMLLVISMYLIKLVLKVWVGEYMHSPVITGEGYHSGADALIGMLVIYGVYQAHKPEDEEFSFGRESREHIFQAIGGIALFYTTWQVLSASIAGLTYSFPVLGNYILSTKNYLDIVHMGWIIPIGVYEPVTFNNGYTFLGLAVMLGSAISSYYIGRYQVKIGTKYGSAAVSGDGEETKGDGYIELGVSVGILTQYFFGVRWLEHVCGLGITLKLAHTAWELTREGFGSLYNILSGKSLDISHRHWVKDIILKTYGVMGIQDLQMFIAGGTAVVSVKINSLAASEGLVDIKYAIAEHILPYLQNAGFKKVKLFIRFDQPAPNRHRVAFALLEPKWIYRETFISPTLAEANKIAICEVVHGRYERIVYADELPTTLIDRVQLLKEKRVAKLFIFHPNSQEQAAITHAGLEYHLATTYLPPNLDLV